MKWRKIFALFIRSSNTVYFVSVSLHTKFQAVTKINLVVRGFYGEGTQASGDFYQISNQSTLGRTEKEILENLNPDMGPVELLRSVAVSQLEFFIRHKDYIRLSITSLDTGSPAFKKRLMEPLQVRRIKQIDSLTVIIDRGKAEGRFRSDIPTRDMVHAFLGMVTQSTHTACMLEPEREIRVDQTIDNIMRILTEGIASSHKEESHP